jgi:glucose/arabinose dehydrogenase
MIARRPLRLLASALATGTALALAVVAAPGSSLPAAAATVPAGFTDALVAEFDRPTTVEWLPSGRLAVLEQGGNLRLGAPGGAFATALDLDVCLGSERGLLGVAADPAFLTNGWLYLYYTRSAPAAPGGCVNRLSRFTLAGGTVDRASELVLLDNISSVNGNHNGGAVEVGGDGFLYVGVGDAGRDPRGDSGSAGSNDAAQDLSLLNGKVLRITADGQPAPGNPLLGQAGVTACATRGNTAATPTTPCAEIYAWGLRNPYRLAFDRDAGSGTRFHINDVGQGTYEEVDLGAPANFGWPEREGPCPQGDEQPCAAPTGGLVDPVTAYTRDIGTFITGGVFVPHGVWPAEYDGAYLFGDGGVGDIWVLRPGAAVDYADPFATGAGGLTDMVFGWNADGVATLYYATIGGDLRAVTPAGAPAVTPDTPSVFEPVAPHRVFDTEGATTGGPGGLVAGTTRLVDSGLPAGTTAALVNLTFADTAGPGYLRTWIPRGARPATSTVNADAAGSFVANAAVVPVDAEGRFLIEVATAARVVVDVMGSFRAAEAATAAGRFVPLTSVRLADTRLPAGPANQYTDDGSTTLVDVGRGGFPAGAEVGAYVLSLAAIAAPGAGGFLAAYPGGGEYTGTSNVNVTPGDVRANMVVVPADGSGKVSIEHLNTAGLVVDVLGYFTGAAAPAATAGQFRLVHPTRLVDSRVPTGFDRLGAGETGSIALQPESPAVALVQNVTVTGVGEPGYLSTHPGDAPVAGVSTINWTGPGQTRAVLAFTQLSDTNRVGYTPLVATDLVADAVGLFTE